MGFPEISVVKNPAVNVGEVGLIPGSGEDLLEKEAVIHPSILA